MKWNLWRTTTWGAMVGIAIVFVEDVTFPELDLLFSGPAPAGAQISRFLGGASWIGALFALVAIVRNWIVRKSTKSE